MNETKTANVELTKKVYSKLRKKMTACKDKCDCQKCGK